MDLNLIKESGYQKIPPFTPALGKETLVGILFLYQSEAEQMAVLLA